MHKIYMYVHIFIQRYIYIYINSIYVDVLYYTRLIYMFVKCIVCVCVDFFFYFWDFTNHSLHIYTSHPLNSQFYFSNDTSEDMCSTWCVRGRWEWVRNKKRRNKSGNWRLSITCRGNSTRANLMRATPKWALCISSL